MNSQKLLETDEILERVDQLMSGKLKSPTINTGLGDTAIVVKYSSLKDQSNKWQQHLGVHTPYKR